MELSAELVWGPYRLFWWGIWNLVDNKVTKQAYFTLGWPLTLGWSKGKTSILEIPSHPDITKQNSIICKKQLVY